MCIRKQKPVHQLLVKIFCIKQDFAGKTLLYNISCSTYKSSLVTQNAVQIHACLANRRFACPLLASTCPYVAP